MYGCVAREDERADGRHGRDPSQGDAEDVHVLDEQARGRVPSADEVGLGKPVVHEEGGAGSKTRAGPRARAGLPL